MLLEHSAILSAFIKLPFVITIFVLSIFELPFYTGFTVCIIGSTGTEYSVNPDQVAHLSSLISLSRRDRHVQ